MSNTTSFIEGEGRQQEESPLLGKLSGKTSEPPNEQSGERIDQMWVNDTAYGEDLLWYRYDAFALSRVIKDVPTPFTIGIFGPWGSGKSFLLHLISNVSKELIKPKEVSSMDKIRNYCCKISCILCTLIFSLISFAAVGILSYLTLKYSVLDRKIINSTNLNSTRKDDSQNPPWIVIFLIIGLTLCAAIILFIMQVCKKPHRYFCLWFRMLFCKVSSPIHKNQERNTKGHGHSKYIFVDFNAWKYAGCENVWAALVMTLAKAVEKEFGSTATRMFRMNYEDASHRHHEDNQKMVTKCKVTCGCPTICFQLLIIACGMTASIAAITWINSYAKFAVPVAFALVIAIPLVKLLVDYFKSQGLLIESAMKGMRKDVMNELGFMDLVKTEIHCIVAMIKLAEHLYKWKYKVIITIDDLDRIQNNKVKAVLDAIHILLSDHNSPFVCLVAADPDRTAKCIEESMSSKDHVTTINGHDYMHKIVNLPFYIPDYTGGKHHKLFYKHFLKSGASPGDHTVKDVVDASKNCKQLQEDRKGLVSSCKSQMITIVPEYVKCHPRTMKRLLNSVTLAVEELIHKFSYKGYPYGLEDNNSEEVLSQVNRYRLARRLTYWIILTDLWPYRMRVLVTKTTHVDEDVAGSQRDPLTAHLDMLIKRVAEEIANHSHVPDFKGELERDNNKEMFVKCLKDSKLSMKEILFCVKNTANICHKSVVKTLPRNQTALESL